MAAIHRMVQAFVLIHTGDLAGALAAAQQAVDIDPYWTRTYVTLMQTQLKLGGAADAEATMRNLEQVQAANRNPSDPFYALMAEALWAGHEGNYDAAREHYTAYLERWGEADVTIQNVEDARQRLAQLP